MPLFPSAVAAVTLGLIFGFARLHALTALFALVAVLRGLDRRRGTLIALAGMLVAGDAIATARRWKDADCLTQLARADSIRAVLLTDALPGAFARGVTREGGCSLRLNMSVQTGRAPYGTTVIVTGTIVASGEGLFVKPARIAPSHGAGVLARMRSRASRAIERDFREDAPLAKALLIADMSDLGTDMRDRFAAAGLVHILSISGLHVTIVAAAMLLLLEAARLPKKYALIAGCILTGAYVALIGAPPPAVRAAVMFGALAASKLLQRPTSAWATLALGAAWPLPGDSRIVLDPGWQLTVAGMVALIAAGRVNKRHIATRFKGWRHTLAVGVSTGVIATLVTAPLVTWYFGRLSLVAPVANIAAEPVAALLQPTLFLSLGLSWWPSASALIADAARPGLHALDGVATAAAMMPGANFGVAPTLAGAVLAGIAIVAVVAAIRSKRPLRPLTGCLAALACIAWLPFRPLGSGELELHAIDVGQADAIALRTPHGQWVLVDAGGAWAGGDAGRRSVVPYIRRRGGDVALFVLTHPHLDHVGGAAAVLQALRPREYWDGAYLSPISAYRAALDVAARLGIPWRRARPGDSVTIDGVRLHVLAPDSAWTLAQTDPNNASTVLMVEYGHVRMLLMGDAEAPEEEWIEARWGDSALHADVLKAGHHGSRTSSTPHFLDDVRPRVAIVSVGAGNTYGLPSASVMAAFASRGYTTLRTDQIGSIVVSTDGRRLRVAGADGAWYVPP